MSYRDNDYTIEDAWGYSSELLGYMLATCCDKEITAIVAENPNTPSDALDDYLYMDLDDEISRNISKNPSAPAKSKLKWRLKTGYNIEGLK